MSRCPVLFCRRRYVHKILVVIEPLLIDEDYYARVEGREIIANLAKALPATKSPVPLLVPSLVLAGRGLGYHDCHDAP